MTQKNNELAPPAKAALVGVSVILHLAVFALIWILIPTGEKPINQNRERTAIPEQLVETVREKVENRQLAELKMKLSELQNLQTAIAAIRETRVERWQQLSAALEVLAPEAAAVLAVEASAASAALRASLAREVEFWETYRQAAASPENGLVARDGSRLGPILNKQYENIRLDFAALREQQRLLREKLALGGVKTKHAADAIAALEDRVAEAVASLDAMQAARTTHERLFNEHRGAWNRLGSLQRNKETAEEAARKARAALAATQAALAEAETNLSRANEKLAQADSKDRRAFQAAQALQRNAQNDVSRRLRELTQRQNSLQTSEARLAEQNQTFQEAQSALRESSEELARAFSNLQAAREQFLKEATALLKEQDRMQSKDFGS